MDAPIGDQFFQRQTGNLPPHGIEAGDDDGVGSVVDDHVDAGRQLEGANVPAFATDDASLHFIIRQRDGRHRRLDALLRRNSLDSQRDDFLRFTLGVALGRLTDLTDPVGSVGLRFLLHPVHELGFGVIRRDAGQLLEPPSFFAEQLLELLLALAEITFAGNYGFGAPVRFALALLQ